MEAGEQSLPFRRRRPWTYIHSSISSRITSHSRPTPTKIFKVGFIVVFRHDFNYTKGRSHKTKVVRRSQEVSPFREKSPYETK